MESSRDIYEKAVIKKPYSTWDEEYKKLEEQHSQLKRELDMYMMMYHEALNDKEEIKSMFNKILRTMEDKL